MRSGPPDRLVVPPAIAVVLLGRGTARAIEQTLDSLIPQTVHPQQYEVVVVSDPGADEVLRLLDRYAGRLPLIRTQQSWSGRGAAKSLGTLCTAAPLVLFLEAGDIAAPEFLVQHVVAHQAYPDRHQAVVGRLCDPSPPHDERLTESLVNRGEPWCTAWRVSRGRISFKRSFLLDAGLFDSRLKELGDDVELLIRLANHGVHWIGNDDAVVIAAEDRTSGTLLERWDAWGRCLYICAQLHSSSSVRQSTGIDIGAEASARAVQEYDALIAATREIVRLTASRERHGPPLAAEDRAAAADATTALARIAVLRGAHRAAAAHALAGGQNGADVDWTQAALEPGLDLVTRSFASQAQWDRYWTAADGERASQQAVEARLPSVPGATVRGYCSTCARVVEYQIDGRYMERIDDATVPNWREQLTCPTCGLNSRKRAAAQAVCELLSIPRQGVVLMTEQTTSLYRALARRYPNLVGCEYLGAEVKTGSSTAEGIRNENLTALTFDDGQFDGVLVFDVLEHLSDTRAALAECWRVLAGGGQLLFSVPFFFTTSSRVRARERLGGAIEHLTVPTHHENPLSLEGSLVFHDFGWDLLDLARRVGFEQVRANHVWSQRLSYFGPQLLFSAQKPSQPSRPRSHALRVSRRRADVVPRRLSMQSECPIDARDERLSFVLPVALSDTGRPGSDLERLAILFNTFTKSFALSDVAAFIVVSPPQDLAFVERELQALGCGSWVTLADQRVMCPVLGSDPATIQEFPAPNKGWYRQQLIKLAAARYMPTPFYMTLDSDVIFTGSFSPQDLVRDGRSVVNLQTENDFRNLYTSAMAQHELEVRRHRDARAESILDLHRTGDGFYGETPVVLSTSVVHDLLNHLERRFPNHWSETLIGQIPWTEYTLYFTYAEATGRFDSVHVRGDLDSVLRMTDSLWHPKSDYRAGRSLADLACLPAPRRDSVAVVVQSYLGYDIRSVRARLLMLGLLH